jgi:hypothetical protein
MISKSDGNQRNKLSENVLHMGERDKAWEATRLGPAGRGCG